MTILPILRPGTRIENQSGSRVIFFEIKFLRHHNQKKWFALSDAAAAAAAVAAAVDVVVVAAAAAAAVAVVAVKGDSELKEI